MQETAGVLSMELGFPSSATFRLTGRVLGVCFAVPAGGGFPDPEEDSGRHELVQSRSCVLLSLLGPYNCNGSFGLVNGFILRYRLDHNSHPRLHPYNFPGERQ